MKQTNSFKFVSLEDVQAKILEIPYKGEELSMLVLLPNEVDGLQEVKPGIHSLHAIAHISSDSVLVWAAHRLVVLAGSIEQKNNNNNINIINISGSMVKNPPAVCEPQETWVQSLGQENPLEEEMTTHSSTSAWEIPWTEEPGGMQTMGSQKESYMIFT